MLADCSKREDWLLDQYRSRGLKTKIENKICWICDRVSTSGRPKKTASKSHRVEFWTAMNKILLTTKFSELIFMVPIGHASNVYKRHCIVMSFIELATTLCSQNYLIVMCLCILLANCMPLYGGMTCIAVGLQLWCPSRECMFYRRSYLIFT